MVPGSNPTSIHQEIVHQLRRWSIESVSHLTDDGDAYFYSFDHHMFQKRIFIEWLLEGRTYSLLGRKAEITPSTIKKRFQNDEFSPDNTNTITSIQVNAFYFWNCQAYHYNITSNSAATQSSDELTQLVRSTIKLISHAPLEQVHSLILPVSVKHAIIPAYINNKKNTAYSVIYNTANLALSYFNEKFEKTMPKWKHGKKQPSTF